MPCLHGLPHILPAAPLPTPPTAEPATPAAAPSPFLGEQLELDSNGVQLEAAGAGVVVGKNSIIMNNPDLMLRKSILTKNDAITQHR
jgi:hypothetical protein